ncbi:hypothetical protein ZHAS_00009352 [Anopheles sinensis]|uniref:Uncharacterized protein n=1 Tax=Anopheles sinensis TaxID=74873 RepID=A0A084VUS7_ANOSI|nr:hypothetical protein ZHAS_00009352 [Anopheles sinensis]
MAIIVFHPSLAAPRPAEPEDIPLFVRTSRANPQGSPYGRINSGSPLPRPASRGMNRTGNKARFVVE